MTGLWICQGWQVKRDDQMYIMIWKYHLCPFHTNKTREQGSGTRWDNAIFNFFIFTLLFNIFEWWSCPIPSLASLNLCVWLLRDVVTPGFHFGDEIKWTKEVVQHSCQVFSRVVTNLAMFCLIDCWVKGHFLYKVVSYVIIERNI